MDVAEKIAIVTGAASGIGLAIAQSLAAKGAEIALCDVNEDALYDVKKKFLQDGATVTAHRLDVTQRGEWDTLCEVILQKYGGAQILCSNAGISSQRAPIGDLDPETWDNIIGVNLTGVFNGAHYFLSRLHNECEDGHIVNTASICGLFSTPTLGAYTSSKFGVVGLSEVMRAELAEKNVGVSVLCPGFVNTGIVAHTVSENGDIDPEREALAARLNASMPASQVGAAVVQGIEKNLPYILTHAEYEDVIRARAAGIEQSLQQSESNNFPDDIRSLGHSWLG